MSHRAQGTQVIVVNGFHQLPPEGFTGSFEDGFYFDDYEVHIASHAPDGIWLLPSRSARAIAGSPASAWGIVKGAGVRYEP